MPSRTFVDADGQTWMVWAVHPTSRRGAPDRAAAGVHPAFRMGWLVFESGPRKRRLAPIPAGWESLSDRECAALCARAEPAAAPSRRSISTGGRG